MMIAQDESQLEKNYGKGMRGPHAPGFGAWGKQTKDGDKIIKEAEQGEKDAPAKKWKPCLSV